MSLSGENAARARALAAVAQAQMDQVGARYRDVMGEPWDDGNEQLLREFLSDITVTARRLELQGQMPRAIVLRDDLWRGMATVLDYPVVRVSGQLDPPWGVMV